MRRRRFDLTAATLLLLGGGFAPLDAQGNEGAIFLLLPIGARAVGVGQAAASGADGSEAVWWNPAGLADASRREVAIHHSTTFIATGDAISLVIPSRLLGVITASADILNFGEQDVTDPGTGQKVGEVIPRNIVLAATYATELGEDFHAGLTYKVVQLRFDCSGSCEGAPESNASTTALDAGIQYDLRRIAPVTIGLMMRNFGPRLQVRDEPQADDLPTRIQLGARYRVPGLDSIATNTEVFLSSDVVSTVSGADLSTRFGAEVVYDRRFFVRGGYSADEADTGGPALGLGFRAGDLILDVARVFEGFSVDAGRAPTYLSVRYLF